MHPAVEKRRIERFAQDGTKAVGESFGAFGTIDDDQDRTLPLGAQCRQDEIGGTAAQALDPPGCIGLALEAAGDLLSEGACRQEFLHRPASSPARARSPSR